MENNKFVRGKVYKIISENTDKIYVGSTVAKYLCSRLSCHVYHYKRYEAGKGTFVSSFDILKCGNYRIVLLESFPCNNKDELAAREQYHIEQNRTILVNRFNAVFTLDKEAISARKSERILCVCGKEHSRGGKANHLRSRKHLAFFEEIPDEDIED